MVLFPEVFNQPESFIGLIQVQITSGQAELADWYRAAGTEESPGTVLATVVGDVQRAGVAEIELGTPVTRATYGISLEPLGGSPTGAPTGPVIHARLVQATP